MDTAALAEVLLGTRVNTKASWTTVREDSQTGWQESSEWECDN